MQIPTPGCDSKDQLHELDRAAVLIVDDEPGMRNFLLKMLRTKCGRVDVAEHAVEAAGLLDQHSYDVIILDNIMPDETGVDWLAEQRRVGLFSEAILITAHADLETAIQAMRAGASDFLLKPFRSNQVFKAIALSMERARLRRQNALLSYELEIGTDLLKYRDALLGSSDEIQAVRQVIERAGMSQAHAVIYGEVGSGKQVAARMLHSVSQRSGRPFAWVQCHGITEEAFAARLFGQLQMRDDGSVDGGEGILTSAAGGTLYLEDVDMLTPACQNVLAELLGTGRFRPVGARRSMDMDIRVVCSCTRSLKDLAADRIFRPDLFYMLSVIEIILPPLRERVEDILDLTAFFTNKLSGRMGAPAPEFSAAVRRRFLSYSWPGNVMELRNTVERALIHGDFDGALDARAPLAETESLAAVEQRHMITVLDACNGNRAEAARRLGVSRKTVDRKCQSWGL